MRRSGTNHQLSFTPDELRRLRECCRALGTTYVEFIHWATMQAVDECEGYGRDEALRREAYKQAEAKAQRRAAEFPMDVQMADMKPAGGEPPPPAEVHFSADQG